VTPEGLKMTVYFGERDRVGGHLLSDVLMELLAETGVLASVLLRGAEGFGIKHQLRTDRILTLSEDLPLVVVAVDLASRIGRLAAEVVPIVGGGLVTLERVALPDLQLHDDPLLSGPDDARLTLYCGRDEERRGRPVVASCLAAMHEAGLPAGTALLGLDGTILGDRRRARFFAGNEGVPAVVLGVGPRDRLAALLPRLRGLVGRHVMSVERVRIARLGGAAIGEIPALAERDLRGLARWRRVTVVCGDRDAAEGRPLAGLLLRRLREAGAAGATVLRGTRGFRDGSPVEGDRLTAIRRRTPLVLTLVDTVPEVARLWPLVERATAGAGLVTSEVVPAFRATAGGLRVGGLELADPHD
jgi:PII-like signaling protein